VAYLSVKDHWVAIAAPSQAGSRDTRRRDVVTTPLNEKAKQQSRFFCPPTPKIKMKRLKRTS